MDTKGQLYRSGATAKVAEIDTAPDPALGDGSNETLDRQDRLMLFRTARILRAQGA
jgi:hypothetical protein